MAPIQRLHACTSAARSKGRAIHAGGRLGILPIRWQYHTGHQSGAPAEVPAPAVRVLNLRRGNGPSDPAATARKRASHTQVRYAVRRRQRRLHASTQERGIYNWSEVLTTWRLAEPAFPEQPPVVTARSNPQVTVLTILKEGSFSPVPHSGP